MCRTVCPSRQLSHGDKGKVEASFGDRSSCDEAKAFRLCSADEEWLRTRSPEDVGGERIGVDDHDAQRINVGELIEVREGSSATARVLLFPPRENGRGIGREPSDLDASRLGGHGMFSEHAAETARARAAHELLHGDALARLELEGIFGAGADVESDAAHAPRSGVRHRLEDRCVRAVPHVRRILALDLGAVARPGDHERGRSLALAALDPPSASICTRCHVSQWPHSAAFSPLWRKSAPLLYHSRLYRASEQVYRKMTRVVDEASFWQDAYMDEVADIKARLDVVDVVGEYVPLKPAGAGSFKGVCPFHQERTPSFHVSRARQSWHCFGCDTGGDIFSFVEKIEGMEFRDALHLLAQKAGVTLAEPEKREQATTKKRRLHEVNELAMKFFCSVLQQLPQAAHARAYVEQRQIDPLTVDLFHIGYAPESWSLLTEALQKRGVTSEELVTAGLAMKRERGDGVYDRFRGRLMFPITDVHGNVVGFTGRILVNDPNQPKYMNTPETPVYRKSAVLYGLDKAKGEIRKQGLVVIVEGNMDVVSSHQAGITNVVAASGTALTGEQLSLIKRFTTNIAIAFDQDAAGGAATLRGLDLARQQDFSIKIISLPPEAGKDPDEACKKDPNLWRQAIAHATSIMEWVYRRAFARHGLGTPEGKRAIADEILPELSRIAHPVERDAWVKRLASDLGVSESSIMQGTRRVPNAEPRQPQVTQKVESSSGGAVVQDRAAWRWFASGLLSAADLEACFASGEAPLELEGEAELVALYQRLRAVYTATGFQPPHASAWSQAIFHLTASLEPNEVTTFTTLSLLAEHAFASRSRNDIVHERQELSRHLRQAAIGRKRTELMEAMRQAEAAGDIARIHELTLAFSALRQDL